MSERLALVTGGHRRLGAAIAARLAQAGYDVAIHGRHDAEPEPALAKTFAAAGVRWHGFVADLAEAAAAAGLVGRVSAHFGAPLDLLVNSAAMFGQDRLAAVSGDELARHFAVNATAPALLTQAFAAQGGSGRAIVNLHDQRLDQPHGDQFAYTLSKYALAGLTAITARTLAPHIRVNAVAPGLTLATEDYGVPQLEALAARMPLERLPTPADVADAVLYLATAEAVTGQVVRVDGGAHHRSFDRDFVHL